MHDLIRRLRPAGGGSGCDCDPGFEDDRLVVDATDCDGDGRLHARPRCRETAVEALIDRDASVVVTRTAGVERVYDDGSAALLVAAGRFADVVADRDPDLADRATVDPLAAAREATARAGPVAAVAAETGLAIATEQAADPEPHETDTGSIDGADYESVLKPVVSPRVGHARVTTRTPDDARLRDARDLSTDATARLYDRPDGVDYYHLTPAEADLSPAGCATLSRARDLLVDCPPGERAPGRAVRRALAGDRDPSADRGLDPDPAGAAETDERRSVDHESTLAAVLRKHTRGYGVLEDFLADPAVSDVFCTAPADEGRLRVVADGEAMETNVALPEAGRRALASRIRRESGRAFSRASPTVDARVTLSDGTPVRVAGVTEPVSDGLSVAVRDGGDRAWTLPALVDNGTCPAEAAALLSLAVERAAAILVAGPRGAGKTTTLGALLWELPATTRTVAIEDTPELPLSALRTAGRDVQGLRTDAAVGREGESNAETPGGGPAVSPATALRTALRLGEGALVLGEVRGEEARVLYEAMRVGASSSAVLGTIHGDGADAVRERVVTDLGVPASSFGATDLVVTLRTVETASGTARRVGSIQEVIDEGDGVRFGALYEFGPDGLTSTGRVERGDSHLVADLAAPAESYADVRTRLGDRRETLAELVRDGRTDPEAVTSAYATRGEDVAGTAVRTDRRGTDD